MNCFLSGVKKKQQQKTANVFVDKKKTFCLIIKVIKALLKQTKAGSFTTQCPLLANQKIANM